MLWRPLQRHLLVFITSRKRFGSLLRGWNSDSCGRIGCTGGLIARRLRSLGKIEAEHLEGESGDLKRQMPVIGALPPQPIFKLGRQLLQERQLDQSADLARDLL